jgi:hypothetical protein
LAVPDVHADPEKLKQLAKTFVASADQLQQVARALSRALDSSGWQDAERQKFEQDFKQTLKSLTQFTEKLKAEYSPALQKKAAALEQYRGR